MRRLTCALICSLSVGVVQAVELSVSNSPELIAATETATSGTVISLAAGIFQLAQPLRLPSGVTLRGDGALNTIITGDAEWDPGVASLPRKDDPDAYLISLHKVSDVKIENLCLTAPSLHGAVYAANCRGLELANLALRSFRWSGVRTYATREMQVHDCLFVDAGGRQKHTGGALYMHFVKDSEFWNNRISKTDAHPNNVFGFKGYKATNCRIHHKTVDVGFSIEFPFENDSGNEIDHNVLAGTISIPKYAGGRVLPDDQRSFHIHHNWMKQSYALEWSRNCVEVDHNYFDFEPADDGGNLITDHGRVPAPGPTLFHNNLIVNPGRGLFWTKGGYNGLTFRNNHVIANTPTRSEGLFGFGAKTDLTTITIVDNVISCSPSNPRPLIRGGDTAMISIANNVLHHVSDADSLRNEKAARPAGLLTPLKFACGVDGESYVASGKILGGLASQ